MTSVGLGIWLVLVFFTLVVSNDVLINPSRLREPNPSCDLVFFLIRCTPFRCICWLPCVGPELQVTFVLGPTERNYRDSELKVLTLDSYCYGGRGLIHRPS